MKILSYESLDSTMNEARRLLEAGAIEELTCISCEEQTQGRGTQGRVWNSPKSSGIYVSIVHNNSGLTQSPDKTSAVLQALYTQAAGIACIESLYIMTGQNFEIKPINDIYYSGRKLGGILVESKLPYWLITGIGINIKPNSSPGSTSLAEILGEEFSATIDKMQLIKLISEKVIHWYRLAIESGNELIKQEYQRYIKT
jgi:BirA family biotin operon repressor/biotin-[acetyl-CoA-carboxylase] ligase